MRKIKKKTLKLFYNSELKCKLTNNVKFYYFSNKLV